MYAKTSYLITMKNLLILLAFMFVIVSCNGSTIDTDEAIPTNKLDAILSLEDAGDTVAVKDSTYR